MKKIFAIVVALITLIAISLPALSSESINLGGIQLMLGESEQQTKQKLQHSCELIPLGDQSGPRRMVVVSSKYGKGNVLGSIIFKNNKIDSVNKDFGDYTEILPLSRLFDTLNAYSRNGERLLPVSTSLQSHDGSITQEISFWISNKHRVKIMIIKATGFIEKAFLSEEIF